MTLRIDGDLRDWRGVRFAALGEDDGGSMQYALGYDAEALYVGARVADDDIVRSPQASTDEDAVVLTLALPQPDGRFVAHEVWLYPGIAGKQAALGALRSGRAHPVARTRSARSKVRCRAAAGLRARGARAVERAAERPRVHDGARGDRLERRRRRCAIARMLASASGGARALPPLLISGGPNTAIVDFLRAKQLASANIRYDLAADVEGDERLERVVSPARSRSGPGRKCRAAMASTTPTCRSRAARRGRRRDCAI